MRIKKFQESQSFKSYHKTSPENIENYFTNNEFANFTPEQEKDIHQMVNHLTMFKNPIEFEYLTIHRPYMRHTRTTSQEKANCLFIKFNNDYEYLIYKFANGHFVLNRVCTKVTIMPINEWFLCDNFDALKHCWQENFVPI